jgi:hypothetical protein
MPNRGPDYALVFFISGVACGVMYTVCAFVPFGFEPSKSQMQYSDLVAVLLTGIGVILATLAVFIGVAAVWGYSQFQKMTQEASAAHLEKLLSSGKFKDGIDALIVSHVSSQLADGKLRDLLAERIDRTLLQDAQRRDAQQQPRPAGDEPFTDDK